MVRGELHVVRGRAEHLERSPGTRHDRRRTADVDNRRPQFQDRTLVDHHRHAPRDDEGRPIGERPSGQIGADLIWRCGRVAGDADDTGRRGRGRDRILDRVERRGERSVAASRRRLVDMECVRGRRGVEPELERPTGPAIAVAVDRGSGCVDDRRCGRTLWLEAKPDLVVAVAAAAVAGVGHGRVEGRVAGTRHGEEVGALIEVESDEGIDAVEVVVAGDEFPLAGGRVQTIEREDAVEQADDWLAGTADNRFSRQPACGRQRKLIDVDIGAVGRIELGEVNRVVVTGKHPLAGEVAHDRGEVVGVIEPE